MKVSGSAGLAALLFLATALPAAAQLPSVDLSQPLSADQAVRLALERNYTVRLSEERLAIARSSKLQAWGGLVPSLGASWDYTHEKSQFIQDPPNPFQSGRPTESDTRGYSVFASQTLISLPVLFNIAARQKTTGAAEADIKDTERQIAFGVREQYYRMIESVRLREVRREDLRLATEELRRTESLFEVGSVARTDVLKARVRVAEAQSALTASTNQVELDQARIAQSLALPPQSDFRPAENLEPRGDLPDSATAYAEARVNRPDLRAARLRVDEARNDKKAALAGKLPFLTHSFNRNFNRSPGIGVVGVETDTIQGEEVLLPVTDDVRRTISNWSYRIGFTWNILDGLVTESNIQRNSALQRSAENEVSDLELRVDLDVEQALLTIRNARAQILSAREGITSAEEDLNLSQERYSVGLGTILELIDAQVALTRARSAEVQAMAALKIAEAQLDQAVGRVNW
jgi:outer membrane protein